MKSEFKATYNNNSLEQKVQNRRKWTKKIKREVFFLTNEQIKRINRHKYFGEN